MKRFYPVALNVRGKRCLVIGDGAEAADKAARLRDAGAEVTVHDTSRPFSNDQITDQFLVLLTEKDQPALTADVARRCRERRVLLAAIDQPEVSDVNHVSIYRRGALSLAISTDGAAPALAKKIRKGLERSLDAAPLDEFLAYLGKLRERSESEIPDPERRRKALIDAVEDFEFSASVRFPASWKR